jgi:hypothetical protein
MPQDAVLVRGWPELAAGTATLAKNIDDETQRRFQDVAGQIAAQARGATPVVSGDLASTAAVEPGPPVSVSYGGGLPYCGWIEFGGTRGRPYIASGRAFLPAVTAAAPLVTQAANDAAVTEAKGMTWPKPS